MASSCARTRSPPNMASAGSRCARRCASSRPKGWSASIPIAAPSVSTLSLAEIEELFEIRALIEPDVLRRAIPRLSEEDLDRAADVLDAARASFQSASHVGQWGELNWKFHSTLYAPAGRPRSMAVIEKLNINIDRYLRIQLLLTNGTGARLRRSLRDPGRLPGARRRHRRQIAEAPHPRGRPQPGRMPAARAGHRGRAQADTLMATVDIARVVMSQPGGVAELLSVKGNFVAGAVGAGRPTAGRWRSRTPPPARPSPRSRPALRRTSTRPSRRRAPASSAATGRGPIPATAAGCCGRSPA